MNDDRNWTTLSKQFDKSNEIRLLIIYTIFKFVRRKFENFHDRKDFHETFEKKNLDFVEFFKIFYDDNANKSKLIIIALHENDFHYNLSLSFHDKCFFFVLINFFYVIHSKNFIISSQITHVFWKQTNFCKTRFYENHQFSKRHVIWKRKNKCFFEQKQKNWVYVVYYNITTIGIGIFQSHK